MEKKRRGEGGGEKEKWGYKKPPPPHGFPPPFHSPFTYFISPPFLGFSLPPPPPPGCEWVLLSDCYVQTDGDVAGWRDLFSRLGVRDRLIIRKERRTLSAKELVRSVFCVCECLHAGEGAHSSSNSKTLCERITYK